MEEDILDYLSNKRIIIDSLIKTYLPKNIDKNFTNWAFGKSTYKFDLDAINNSITRPIWDFLERGGKRWRPAMFLLIAEALEGDLNKITDFCIVPELAHEGSIMIDDIEDMGETRRGKPCTHKIFGIDIAINAGNMMYFLPLLVFLRNKDKIDQDMLMKAYYVYSQEMINLSVGQGIDIWWHKGKKDDIEEEEYLQMCAYKTGTLARMAAKLGVVLSGGTEEQEQKLGKLAESIGVA
ncbi:MAG: polyprenyl synthetase family protein, partial [Candidatus Aenigmatarchaeota archaeon]